MTLLSPKFQSAEDSHDEDSSLPDSLERYGALKTVLSAGRPTGVAVMCNLPGRGGCVVTALPRRVFMNTLEFQDEIDMKLVAPAATDEALVAAAKLGNHPAFAELWTRHSNTAFKMAYRIVGNRDDAEDVLQDAWMKAYVQFENFRRESRYNPIDHANIGCPLGQQEKKDELFRVCEHTQYGRPIEEPGRVAP
jgi:Sigma-70 region 2